MTTIAFPHAGHALRCALAGLALLWAAPAPAQEPAKPPDCELDETPIGSFATNDVLEVIADNLACLERRVAGLSEENAALKNRLDVIEDERGAAGAAYRNRDGTVDRKDRYLGPATWVVTGDRRGGARSLGLDHDLVLDMCGDADGCLVTLGLAGAVAAGEPVGTMFAGGPCIFHLDGGTGAWSLSGLCAEDALPAAAAPADEPGEEPSDDSGDASDAPAAQGAGTETAATGAAATEAEPAETDGLAPAAAPRSTPLWGRDGDARRFGEARRRARVILGFAGACLLAEAAPETRRFGDAEPRLGADAEADLFLVATGAQWNPEGTFPEESLPLRVTDPDFDCRLTLRD